LEIDILISSTVYSVTTPLFCCYFRPLKLKREGERERERERESEREEKRSRTEKEIKPPAKKDEEPKPTKLFVLLT